MNFYTVNRHSAVLFYTLSEQWFTNLGLFFMLFQYPRVFKHVTLSKHKLYPLSIDAKHIHTLYSNLANLCKRLFYNWDVKSNEG